MKVNQKLTNMNLKKLFVTVAVCALAVVSVNAQVVRGAEAQTKRGPYETNRLFDNVFIGVAGGINWYQGEQDHQLNFKDRARHSLQAYIGKWITPSVGLRLGWYGGKARGFYYNDKVSPTTPAWSGNEFVDPADNYSFGYVQKFRPHHFRGDLMWNISNVIGGYRTDRFVEFAPYVGAGFIVNFAPGQHKFRKQGHHEWAGTVGLYTMFRVCSALDITLDVNQSMFNQSLDGDNRHRRKEYMGSVSMGLAYQFRNREFHRSHAAVDVTPLNNKIKDLNGALEDINAKNEKLKSDLDAEKAKKPAETIIVKGETKYTPAPFAVYFPLGKATLTEDQVKSIQYFVKTSMESSKDRVFEICGAADSATGSAKTNEKLGQARLDAVLNVIKACGGNYKISDKNLGGTSEFSTKDNKLNRVVVVR